MTIKFPATVGECIDKLYVLRAQRLAANKEVERMKAEEAQWETHILNTLAKNDLRGAKGDTATAGIKRATVYNIENWDACLADIRKKRAWDCLRKQLSPDAVAARFDAGKPLAGLVPFERVTLTLNKAGA